MLIIASSLFCLVSLLQVENVVALEMSVANPSVGKMVDHELS